MVGTYFKNSSITLFDVPTTQFSNILNNMNNKYQIQKTKSFHSYLFSNRNKSFETVIQ